MKLCERGFGGPIIPKLRGASATQVMRLRQRFAEGQLAARRLALSAARGGRLRPIITKDMQDSIGWISCGSAIRAMQKSTRAAMLCSE